MSSLRLIWIPLLFCRFLFISLVTSWNVPFTRQKLTCISPWRLRADYIDRIGHFRVPKNLTFKARLSAKPLIWKWFLTMMQIKLIFTTKVSHLTSFWKWVFLELGNGLLANRVKVLIAIGFADISLDKL